MGAVAGFAGSSRAPGALAEYDEPPPAAAGGILPAEFPYEAISAASATALRETAERIRQRLKRQIEDIVHIGRELIAVKAALPHGQFTNWLVAEFSWNERTARNYMNVAAAFGGKKEIIADLRPSHLYRLAAPSTPPEARDSIIAIAEAGQPVTDTLVNETIQHAKLKHGSDARGPATAATTAAPGRPAGTSRSGSPATNLAALIIDRFAGQPSLLQEAIRHTAPEDWIRARDLLLAWKP
nr:DUF3102 domain-containing protein [uncultured Rhodopila sp.]